MTIQLQRTGLVYRNPKPHLRAIHAWHPSVVVLPTGQWLCSFDLGEAAEALNYRTYLSRSSDHGRSWSDPVRLVRHESRPDATHTVRMSRMRDGTLVAMGQWFLRGDPEEGLVNRGNLGMVPTETIVQTSANDGLDWTLARPVQPPLTGPAFEVCHPVVELQDGRWLWPTQTWRGWNGDEPNGIRVVAFVSTDRGRTWPQHLDVINQYPQGVWTWENSLVQMPCGKLVAIGWSYREKDGTSLPNVVAISTDGRTFSPPAPLGLQGETAKLAVVGPDRLLCAYRRMDQPGLWAAMLRIDGSRVTVLEQAPLWQGSASLVQGSGNQADNLSGLQFGYPQIARLGDGRFLIVFWCREDQVQVIRWIELLVG